MGKGDGSAVETRSGNHHLLRQERWLVRLTARRSADRGLPTFVKMEADSGAEAALLWTAGLASGLPGQFLAVAGLISLYVLGPIPITCALLGCSVILLPIGGLRYVQSHRSRRRFRAEQAAPDPIHRRA